MTRFLFILSSLLSLCFQANSQIMGPAVSYLSPRSYSDAIIELPRTVVDAPRNFIDAPRIIEAPRNIIQPQPIIAEQTLVPLNNIPSPTTVITDCTPSVCKNLADTINLMIVSNLLQNTLGDLKSLKMAVPLLKNIASNPTLSRYPGLISSLVNPNLIAPNVFGPNVVGPNVVGPNVVAPNFVAPNAVAPNIVTQNVVPSRIVAPIASPNSVAPNCPVSNGALLSNLLKMLGNPV